MTTVRVRRNGPCVIDDPDVNVVDWNGVEYPVQRRPVALCRCGASATKPFCDGSHARVGFQGGEERDPKGERDGTMAATDSDTRPMEDPEGPLESALITEFLRARGLDARALQALPEDEAKRVLTEASAYAAAKLAEVEARAHFVHGMRGEE